MRLIADQIRRIFQAMEVRAKWLKKFFNDYSKIERPYPSECPLSENLGYGVGPKVKIKRAP